MVHVKPVFNSQLDLSFRENFISPSQRPAFRVVSLCMRQPCNKDCYTVLQRKQLNTSHYRRITRTTSSILYLQSLPSTLRRSTANRYNFSCKVTVSIRNVTDLRTAILLWLPKAMRRSVTVQQSIYIAIRLPPANFGQCETPSPPTLFSTTSRQLCVSRPATPWSAWCQKLCSLLPGQFFDDVTAMPTSCLVHITRT